MDRLERNAQSMRALMDLRALILDGAFAANTRLPETQLAERLGLSRTPLRQAMDRLVEEGLLERIETGGCRVASFTPRDIIDSIELRGVMEGTAARLAAERGAPAAVLADMRATVDALDAAAPQKGPVQFDAYALGNARFHRLLARAAGSPVVEREVERIARLPLASPSAFLQGQDFVADFTQSLRRAQRQHRQMLEAIEAREGSRAEALARDHARLARENLDFLLRADPRLAERVPGLALVNLD